MVDDTVTGTENGTETAGKPDGSKNILPGQVERITSEERLAMKR